MDITIHLGMHKTGSSFLQSHFFKLHQAESGYFSLRECAPGLLKYILYCGESTWRVEVAKEMFVESLRRVGFSGDRLTIVEEMLCGDPYLNAFNRAQVFQRLRAVFPDAKYVLVLREQEAMTQTLYLQYIKLGGSCTWNQFLTYKQPPLMFSWGDYLDYAPYVIDIYRAVGASRFLCMTYEMMLEDQVMFLCRLANFVGFKLDDTEASLMSKIVNPSLSRRSAVFLQHANKFCSSYRQPFLLFPRSVQGLFRKSLVTVSSSQKKVIPERVVAEFCKPLKARNAEISSIIGRDVSMYGY